MGKIKVTCPECKVRLATDEENIGRQLRCPGCKRYVLIQAASAVAAPLIGSPADALAAFSSLSTWARLPRDALEDLARHCETGARAKAFAQFCDELGLTQDVLSRANGQDGTEVLGAFATALSSFGNGLGDSGQIEEARGAFRMALLARPDHVPTWMGLAIVEALLGRLAAAQAWAAKVLAFRPDASHRDSLSLGTAALYASPAWAEVTQQMRKILKGS